MGDFEEELKAGFLEEAVQLLAESEQCFLILEAQPEDKSNLEKIFRIAHNIKGSSKAVGFDALGAYTHEFESFLLKCKSGEIAIQPDTISLLLAGNDHINSYIEALKGNFNAVLNSDDLMARFRNFRPAAIEATPDFGAEISAPATVEDDIALLKAAEALFHAQPDPQNVKTNETESPTLENDANLAEVEAIPPAEETPPALYATNEAVANEVVAAEAANTKAVSGSKSAGSTTDESIRVSLVRLERLLNFVGEQVILQTVLREQSYNEDPLLFRSTMQQMVKVTKEVQDLAMSLRMVPVKQTFQKMQRIVRDTAATLEKKVNLQLDGEDTEVDKTVLDSLGDPLVHLIRNAVDHGIENPAERVAKGKDAFGKIQLKAYHQSGNLVIDVIDDGGGISADRLRQKALEKGILRAGQVLSDREAVDLVFHPGFSTKSQVTEVSGRGVGMDVVKTNIENMQGQVTVETLAGKGSTFKITLPLTMAIIDGMVVRCDGDRYIIPRAHVHESIKVLNTDLKFATGIGEILALRGENLPVLRLAKTLNRKAKSPETNPGNQIAVVVRILQQPFAVVVDEIIGQHQVVIKKMGAELQNIKYFSGSAILGDGRPALILELGELLSAQQ